LEGLIWSVKNDKAFVAVLEPAAILYLPFKEGEIRRILPFSRGAVGLSALQVKTA
jgi:hypothetical protein